MRGQRRATDDLTAWPPSNCIEARHLPVGSAGRVRSSPREIASNVPRPTELPATQPSGPSLSRAATDSALWTGPASTAAGTALALHAQRRPRHADLRGLQARGHPRGRRPARAGDRRPRRQRQVGEALVRIAARPSLQLAAPRSLRLTPDPLSVSVGETGRRVPHAEVHPLVEHSSAIGATGREEKEGSGEDHRGKLRPP